MWGSQIDRNRHDIKTKRMHLYTEMSDWMPSCEEQGYSQGTRISSQARQARCSDRHVQRCTRTIRVRFPVYIIVISHLLTGDV
jgi:hypothetical protein